MTTFIYALLFALMVCTPQPAFAEMAIRKDSSDWHITDYALSPNGGRLAEVVRAQEGTRASMKVVIRDLNDLAIPSHVVFKGSNLSSVRWVSHYAIAFVVSKKGSRILMEDIRTKHVIRLLETRNKVSGLLPAPNRQLLAYKYVSTDPLSSYHHPVSVKVTDDVAVLNLALRKGYHVPYNITSHVGILRWGSHGGRVLANRKWRWTWFPPKMVWANGRLLVLLHGRTASQSYVIDVDTGKRLKFAFPGKWTYLLAFKGHLMASASTLSRELEAGGKGLRIYVRDDLGALHRVSTARSGMVMGLWFGGQGRLIAQVIGLRGGAGESTGTSALTGLVEVDWKKNRIVREFGWPHGILGGWPHVCSVDVVGDRAVCEAQTLRDPPRLVSINLRTGGMTELGYLTHKARRLNFKFRRLTVRNAFGQESRAYLALPRDWRRHGVPLAVMTYGFTREYSRYGQWITSYPVAKLVHAGIAVLLLDFPESKPWGRGDFAAALREMLRAPLSTVAHAVPTVREAGVQVTRAMIMGWSEGGLIAAFAIQDLHQFVAAEVGDPQEWSVSSFALGNGSWRRFLERQLGGPPDRKFINRYLDFDPVADGRSANGPILFEFVSRNVAAGQFLQEWRAVGTHVEAFAYPNSVHWLNVPAEAKISRERNLDWAKLNLLGPGSVSASELRRVGLTVPARGWWSSGRSRLAGHG